MLYFAPPFELIYWLGCIMHTPCLVPLVCALVHLNLNVVLFYWCWLLVINHLFFTDCRSHFQIKMSFWLLIQGENLLPKLIVSSYPYSDEATTTHSCRSSICIILSTLLAWTQEQFIEFIRECRSSSSMVSSFLHNMWLWGYNIICFALFSNYYFILLIF